MANRGIENYGVTRDQVDSSKQLSSQIHLQYVDA